MLPSASLVPENDPTSLFISAGMQPLVSYLMGENHPEGKKLVNIQRCIRTGDIDEIGDESHLTFFEMMGYWSLGAYWKKEAIELIFEFLTKELEIDPKNFAVTCFEGDLENDISKDSESADVWKSLGVPGEKIAYLGYEDNFWGPVGETGPCGPDSELFVWVGEGDIPANFDPKNKGWMELCNDVFMEYNKTTDGKYVSLAQKNVDFGMGFERLLVYLEGESDVYKTDVFEPMIKKIEEISGRKYEENEKEFRVIADHIRSAMNIIHDGVLPSNKDRGYVPRRLFRKCIDIFDEWSIDPEKIISIVGCIEGFNEEERGRLAELFKEEIFFTQNTRSNLLPKVQKRLKIIERLISNKLDMAETADPKWLKAAFIDLKTDNISVIAGKFAYNLWNTMRFPKESFWKKLSDKPNIRIIWGDYIKGYTEAENKFKDFSRTASAGMFKGGLADASDATKKLHTTAHLVLVALKKVLGSEVEQKGSNITAERLRFDFNWPEKMTPEQIKEVEDIVNEQIEKDLPVTVLEMSLEEAQKSGAHGTFSDKYGKKVKVYTIGNSSTSSEPPFSREICGGPHVGRTGDLGHFKIKKEQSSSAGIRRIKAILE